MKLQSVMQLRRQIEGVEILLETLHAQATVSHVEFFTVLVADTERRLENLRGDEAQSRLDLTDAIIERIQSRLPREVMLARYVDCNEFKAIAQRLNYSESTIYRLHRAGLTAWKVAES